MWEFVWVSRCGGGVRLYFASRRGGMTAGRHEASWVLAGLSYRSFQIPRFKRRPRLQGGECECSEIDGRGGSFWFDFGGDGGGDGSAAGWRERCGGGSCG